MEVRISKATTEVECLTLRMVVLISLYMCVKHWVALTELSVCQMVTGAVSRCHVGNTLLLRVEVGELGWRLKCDKVMSCW